MRGFAQLIPRLACAVLGGFMLVCAPVQGQVPTAAPVQGSLDLHEYAGVWEITANGAPVTFAVEGGRLRCVPPAGPPMILDVLGKDHFGTEGGAGKVRVRFQRDAGGKVVSLLADVQGRSFRAERPGAKPLAPVGEAFPAYVRRKMTELQLVGASFGILHADGTVWEEGFGYADAELKRPAHPDTFAMWASCSKVVTAAALLKVLDEKGIGLDVPVDGYLPYPVRNPRHPEVPITFRMLLTHTSSIHSDPEIEAKLYGPADPTLSLGAFLEGYFKPGGPHHKPSHYLDAAPGTTWEYCNVGFALLGHLAERLTGTSFGDHCRRSFFPAVGLRSATWSLQGLDPGRMAVQYRSPGGDTRRVTPYNWPGYPDGMLRCSAREMLGFVSLVATGRPSALKPATIQAMLLPQPVPGPAGRSGRVGSLLGQGLAWRLLELNGHKIWAHDGGGAGMTTLMLLDEKTRSAAVVWMSGGLTETPEGQAFFRELHLRLVAEMQKPGQPRPR